MGYAEQDKAGSPPPSFEVSFLDCSIEKWRMERGRNMPWGIPRRGVAHDLLPVLASQSKVQPISKHASSHITMPNGAADGEEERKRGRLGEKQRASFAILQLPCFLPIILFSWGPNSGGHCIYSVEKSWTDGCFSPVN
jgi:hypothetical protein